MSKQRLTPQQFHALPVPKKIHVLSLAYMATCDPKGFTKSGLFQLRNYFKSIEQHHLQCFYDFIYSLPEPTVVSIYDLYSKSQAWQVNLRMQSNRPETEVAQYPSLFQCLQGL